MQNLTLTHRKALPAVPKRVVILGAGGFVGSALVQHLQKIQVPYLALARLQLDLSVTGADQQLAFLLQEQDSLVILATSMPSNTMDAIALLANIKIAENIIAAVKQKKCCHVIYVSSDAVYPSSAESISEMTVVNPLNLYGTMHLAREQIVVQALGALNIAYTIIRPTQIYGVHARHNAYGPGKMCRSAVQTGTIQLIGLGEERRDFIAINDVVKLLVLVLQHQSVGLINFATGHSLSFAALANEIMSQADFPVRLESISRKINIWHRQFDVSALHDAFPTMSFSKLSHNIRDFLINT